jgi:hypothetical protein
MIHTRRALRDAIERIDTLEAKVEQLEGKLPGLMRCGYCPHEFGRATGYEAMVRHFDTHHEGHIITLNMIRTTP